MSQDAEGEALVSSALWVKSCAGMEQLDRVLSSWSTGRLRRQVWPGVLLCRVNAMCAFDRGRDIYANRLFGQTTAWIVDGI